MAAGQGQGGAVTLHLPAWLRSPRLLVPVSIALVIGLLLAFAWVVQGVVNQAVGAGPTPLSPAG